jgi:hypothetical protein
VLHQKKNEDATMMSGLTKYAAKIEPENSRLNNDDRSKVRMYYLRFCSRGNYAPTIAGFIKILLWSRTAANYLLEEKSPRWKLSCALGKCT